jgi:hypothetical protein
MKRSRTPTSHPSKSRSKRRRLCRRSKKKSKINKEITKHQRLAQTQLDSTEEKKKVLIGVKKSELGKIAIVHVSGVEVSYRDFELTSTWGVIQLPLRPNHYPKTMYNLDKALSQWSQRTNQRPPSFYEKEITSAGYVIKIKYSLRVDCSDPLDLVVNNTIHLSDIDFKDTECEYVNNDFTGTTNNASNINHLAFKDTECEYLKY